MNNQGLHHLGTSNQEIDFLANMHPVFKTELDTYNNVASPSVTGRTTLWDALQKIRYNLLHDVSTELFLTPKYLNGELNAHYTKQKDSQKAICYNATFNGYKNLDNIKTINDLMFLDIDNFDSREEALEYKAAIISKYDWILACSLSLSKIGLHIIVWVDKIHDNEDFNSKYDFISKTYFDGKLDPDSKSLTRYTILPCDSTIYINDNPIQFPIDDIYRKSLSSVYNDNETTSSNALSQEDSKSLGSAYNKNSCDSLQNKSKSLGSAEEREVIYTTQTFSASKEINKVLISTAQQNGLVFKPVVDEVLFEDPNTPLFFPEGIEVIEINLFLYKHKSIPAGRRNRFIGALTTQMIFLNVETKTQPIPDVRESILRYIMSVNNKYCSPPQTYKEVLKSYNSNWKRYMNGEMDFTSYYKLRKSIWSQNCKLTGNQKRSKTMTNIHKHDRTIKLVILQKVIQTMADNGEKVTQNTVLKNIKSLGIEGIGIYRIKSLWKHFKPSIKAYKEGVSKEIIIEKPKSKISKSADDTELLNSDIDVDEDVLDIGADIQKNYEKNLKRKTEEFALNDDQKMQIYYRVYSNILPKLKPEQIKELESLFESKILSFTFREQRLILKDIKEVNESEFWGQGVLESKLTNLLTEIKP